VQSYLRKIYIFRYNDAIMAIGKADSLHRLTRG